MAQTYRLVGSQDPASRIDSVQVADQTLELNGEPMELDEAQPEPQPEAQQVPRPRARREA
jgi:hypothetical protein